ncbi:MAG: hypothetical protein ACI8RZ_006236 [Myxococcota bacterium]|jgi:hypothetical protein
MLILLLACRPDDVSDSGTPYVPEEADADTDADTDTDTDADADADADMSIAADWLSTGSDLSPLFAGSGITRIDASFKSDGSYSVGAVYAGTTYDFTGTYTVDASTDPGAITLSQVEPYATTAEGLWSISGDTLTYEVVDLSNTDGHTAPTLSGGFGSTTGPGLSDGDNIQTYQRQ